jgi:hypothetical protein
MADLWPPPSSGLSDTFMWIQTSTSLLETRCGPGQRRPAACLAFCPSRSPLPPHRHVTRHAPQPLAPRLHAPRVPQAQAPSATPALKALGLIPHPLMPQTPAPPPPVLVLRPTVPLQRVAQARRQGPRAAAGTAPPGLARRLQRLLCGKRLGGPPKGRRQQPRARAAARRRQGARVPAARSGDCRRRAVGRRAALGRRAAGGRGAGVSPSCR